MKASELRSKSVKDLENEHMAIRKELFNIRMQRGIGQTPQTHLFKKLKKQIAMIKTIIREKEGS